MTACIIGWSHLPFGKQDKETLENLIVKAANGALAHAGVAAADIDAIVLGHFNAGFSPQDFTASLVLQADPALRFKPATRVENACATGSAAVFDAVTLVEARRARRVLVVGAEQMTRTPGPEIGRNLLRASYLAEEGDTPGGFAGVFGQIAANWRGKPLRDWETILRLVSSTRTKTGLVVHAELDKGTYPTGIKVSDEELAAVNLVRNAFHGEWNYTVKPSGQA